jgi:hypothetical protein
MFSEILKIIPRLSGSDVENMERNLTARFGKIAKKFGSGLKASLIGGGIAGIALGVIDKLLNPLKEVQDKIDKIMHEGDDLVTYAKQFGTTPGKLKKLELIGQSTGLDQDSLFMLMNKFQNKIAETLADPKAPSSVKNFTNIPDTADAFFQFVQALRSMDKNSQLLVQQDVFGEKQTLKMSDFLNTDMAKQLELLRLLPTAAYDSAANKAGAFNDTSDIMSARRGGEDFVKTSNLLNSSMLSERDRQLRNEDERDRTRVASYHSLMEISETSAKMLNLLEKEGLTLLRQIAPHIKSIGDIAAKIPFSRLLRGVIPGGDK